MVRITEKTLLLYRNYKITKGFGMANNSLYIYYPNGVKSIAAPGSLAAAKRMIDKDIDSGYSIYDETGFKDKNVIEKMPEKNPEYVKPEAVYSNKNWAA